MGGKQLPFSLGMFLEDMGVEFPSTDESAYRAKADHWRSIARNCREQINALESANKHIVQNNAGPTVQAFSAYMGGQSNLTGLKALEQCANKVADGCQQIAVKVTELKDAIIAEAMGLTHLLTMPIALGVGPLFWQMYYSAAKQAGQRCRQLDQQTAAVIRGE